MSDGGRAGPGGTVRPTAIGGLAILLWSTQALLTTGLVSIPPFQLVAMAFSLAFVVGVVWATVWGRGIQVALRQPWPVWLTGIGGLFGYHFLYFLAFRLAPGAAVEVNLINNLWPLLIVLFSAVLPGERLKGAHVAGGLLGLVGTAVLLTRGGGRLIEADGDLAGGVAALACAVSWAGYSVLSRGFGRVPTETVAGYCLGTAALAALSHLAFETTVVPAPADWPWLLALGVGPVGMAFYLWDHGVKRGDIRALGALSYAAPLLSTLLLISFGAAEADWTVAVAAILIVGGAALASLDVLRRPAARVEA